MIVRWQLAGVQAEGSKAQPGRSGFALRFHFDVVSPECPSRRIYEDPMKSVWSAVFRIRVHHFSQTFDADVLAGRPGFKHIGTR